MDTSNSNPGYQFFFSSEDFDSATQNGFGTYLGGRQVCARVRGGNYCSGLYLSREVPMDVTITYNGVDSLKFYRNGELFTTLTVKRPLVVLDSAKTMISPTYKDGTNLRKFEGSIEYLKVFNRVLGDEEIRNNYTSSGVTNSEALELYYDFTEVKYQSNDGYYPTVKDDYIMTTAEGQILTALPDDTNRDYIIESNKNNTVTYKKYVDDKLENIFDVYASSINTINLEFDDNYSDLSFSYKNGDYQSDAIKVSDRVYSFSYDFNNDLEITISSSNDNKTFKYTCDELARKIKVIDDKYYHITEGVLYKNDKKIVDKALHVWNNLVLLNNGVVYDFVNNKELDTILQSGILANPISLYEFSLDNIFVRTYYNHSEVVDSSGTTIREGQIMVRDSNMFVFDYNSNTKNDMNIFDVYNTSLYQISLTNNSLVAIMNEINLPNYFMNSNIEEVSFDVDSDEPILLVRYSNGYIYALNYYTGDELFEYGNKMETSLFRFIFDSFSLDTTLSVSNDSYDESSELKSSLISVKDDKVKDKLNINVDGNSNDSGEDLEVDTSEFEVVDSKEAKKKEVTSKYIQVYDYDTNTYEVYNTNDLLNPVNKEVVSERIKIKSDSFLYNYFYDNKINRLLDRSKILIYVAIIVLVLVNLVFFVRYLSTKEVKNHG